MIRAQYTSTLTGNTAFFDLVTDDSGSALWRNRENGQTMPKTALKCVTTAIKWFHEEYDDMMPWFIEE